MSDFSVRIMDEDEGFAVLQGTSVGMALSSILIYKVIGAFTLKLFFAF